MSWRSQRQRVRFGIGEWYGRSFLGLSDSERKYLAEIQGKPKRERPVQPCPFQSGAGRQVACLKEGGVCSLRLYQEGDNRTAVPAEGVRGGLRVTCPYRFNEGDMIYQWVGAEILGCQHPIVVGEVGFLRSIPTALAGADQESDVGRIDNVLVVPESDPLAWCALEIQAVYFSGSGMRGEFRAIAESNGRPVFPVGQRRPDYRSSGPKRLMPQLQIKVPSLRRWGKKLAVVVDEAFFDSLSEMDSVHHVTNCDIAWFVGRFREARSVFHLVLRDTHFTTLETAVEGLTAGKPVSLSEFESRLREKIAASPRRA